MNQVLYVLKEFWVVAGLDAKLKAQDLKEAAHPQG